MNRLLAAAAGIAALSLPHAFAQTACPGAATLAGAVRDSTQALIPGAALTLDGNRATVSSPDGRFAFACVSSGSHHLSVTAQGFAPRDLALTTPYRGQLDIALKIEAVETEVSVDADDDTPAAESATSSGPAESISGSRLQSLADDPDDLQRELQQLAAAAGGDPANITIAVDGFQSGSTLPPKSSIAYIKVNPDLFSSEYREPPIAGGRVEVYTKPGQKAYHGALFATNGSPWENARDPFSTSKAALGKQRYGAELTGPIRKTGSDFNLTFEHRIIQNFAVVNAITFDSFGNNQNTSANVATPQSLWLATSRLDWQLGAKNTFIAYYSANINSLQNVGVGGLSLASTGYDSQRYEHIFRLSNVTTASLHFMHESRVSLRWHGESDSPDSTAPQLQVAGAFTGGGATTGAQQLHQLDIEADDDAILTTKKHTLKFGTQLMIYRERQQLTTNFNGTYTFGGGTAPVLDANSNPIPGQTETITGVEQYRRTLLNLAGGTPTAFTNVTGSPAVDFTQLQDAVFLQDDWNVRHGLHIASGLRYFFEADPAVLSGITPRLGILWSPDKKNRWTLHAHAGMFTGIYDPGMAAEARREDGIERTVSTIYNPVYGNPFAGATPIHSMREYAPHFAIVSWAAENLGGTVALPHSFNLTADYYLARLWNDARSENINSPLNYSPTGPRPIAPNLDILQIQNSGQGAANAVFAGIEQHSLKRAQFFVGGLRINLIDDTDDKAFSTPQSAHSDAGEFAHRTGQGVWQLFGNATFTLPRKLQLSADLNGSGDAHYNIITGFDNNGDGDFNDRPQYAAPGTPNAVATPWGLLTASGGTGVFPRNHAVMPWTIYLDSNLQRAFTITRNKQAEHQQTLTLNVRSSNILNHLNVTQVGGVLGSPLFTIPYAADNGRRIEAGLRYSF